MRSSSLMMVLLGSCLWMFTGCPVNDDDDSGSGADDDDTAGEDPCDGDMFANPCCNDTGPRFYLGFDLSFPADQEVTGAFSDWGSIGYGDIQFVVTDGTEHDVWVSGDEDALQSIPDLAAAGEVKVIMRGGCDGEGGFYDVVYVFTGEYPGEMLLLAGSIGVTDLGGWTVEAGSDNTTCMARPDGGCYEFSHNRPVTFTHAGGSVDLYQGSIENTESGRIHLAQAESHSGEELCVDGGGPEYDSWFIVPAN